MFTKVKAFLKKASPVFLMDIYRATRPKRNLDLEGLDTQGVFSKIYEESFWRTGQSLSGSGSDLVQTNVIKQELEKVFKQYQIKSVLDAPCGDFHWMQQVNLADINYLGVDIVDKLIQENKATLEKLKGAVTLTKEESPKRGGSFIQSQYYKVKFEVKNIITDPLPKADLILCRDCLVHLSLADIQSTLENFKKSGATYLLSTTFTKRTDNKDIQTGSWRPINLQIPPFNLPEPLLLIDEKCSEGGGKHRDKMLGLWDVRNRISDFNEKQKTFDKRMFERVW